MVYRKRVSGAGSRIRATSESFRLALVRNAKAMIERRGAEEFSTRDLATAAHATPNAPYYHFKDGLKEILAAVAIEGFSDLHDLLEDLSSESQAERVHGIVQTYVRFGVEHRHLYRVMFSSRLAEPLLRVKRQRSEFRGKKTYIALLAEKARVLELFIAPLSMLRERHELRPGPLDAIAHGIAALAHGLVGEFIDEGIGMEENDDGFNETHRALTRQATEMLLHGLLLGRRD